MVFYLVSLPFLVDGKGVYSCSYFFLVSGKKEDSVIGEVTEATSVTVGDRAGKPGVSNPNQS